MHGDEIEYGSDDIRFTRNKANTVLYATLLDWPEETAAVTRLSKGELDTKTLKMVQLLGIAQELKRRRDEAGLHVEMPKQKPGYGHAYPLRPVFAGEAPGVKSAEDSRD